MIVKVVNKSSNELPKYQTIGSSGMDLCAFLDAPLELKPLERALISTGIYVEIPVGYEIQIRARSGLSIKHGITLTNGIGTIDSDYRGELCVPLVNLSNESYTIQNGDRIAQMILAKYETIDWKIVELLEDSDRSSGGFGHTGR